MSLANPPGAITLVVKKQARGTSLHLEPAVRATNWDLAASKQLLNAPARIGWWAQDMRPRSITPGQALRR